MTILSHKNEAVEWLKDNNSNRDYCQINVIELTKKILKKQPELRKYEDFGHTCIIDVSGDLNMIFKRLHHIPIQLHIVTGNFLIQGNKLRNLLGCPLEIHGYFDCHLNSLFSLEGCPEKIFGSLNCSDNFLNNLQYCPKEIHGDLNCANNKLNHLLYLPDYIRNHVIFDKNEKLLEYADLLKLSKNSFLENKNFNFWQSIQKHEITLKEEKIIMDDIKKSNKYTDFLALNKKNHSRQNINKL